MLPELRQAIELMKKMPDILDSTSPEMQEQLEEMGE